MIKNKFGLRNAAVSLERLTFKHWGRGDNWQKSQSSIATEVQLWIEIDREHDLECGYMCGWVKGG